MEKIDLEIPCSAVCGAQRYSSDRTGNPPRSSTVQRQLQRFLTSAGSCGGDTESSASTISFTPRLDYEPTCREERMKYSRISDNMEILLCFSLVCCKQLVSTLGLRKVVGRGRLNSVCYQAMLYQDLYVTNTVLQCISIGFKI